MKNKKRMKEYLAVVIVNVLFAFYTNLFMNGVPYISLHVVTEITYFSILGWFLYGSFLYMILKWNNVDIQGGLKHISISFGVGTLIVFMKAVFDYILGIFITNNQSLTRIAIVEGVLIAAFGVCLIISLFVLFVKGKRQWSKRVNKPVIFLVADILFYLGVLIWVFYESNQMRKLIGTSADNLLKIDYYFAHIILPLNVWTYTFLIVIIWWLMRVLYDEDDETFKNKTIIKA